MTFKKLAAQLNHNRPSGAEKSCKSALRKSKKDLYSGAYGQWLSIQKTINKARAKSESDPGCYMPPQTTWIDEFVSTRYSATHGRMKQNKQYGTRLRPDTVPLLF